MSSLQGTQFYPDIPMCLISLYCDDDTATPLRYDVPVEGIKEDKTIFIMRHVETLRNTQGIMSSSDYYCCNNCNYKTL